MKFKQNCYSQDDLLFDSIRCARSELKQAVNIFNEMTGDTAVDYASYNLLAARAKYSYLLQVAKEKNLSV